MNSVTSSLQMVHSTIIVVILPFSRREAAWRPGGTSTLLNWPCSYFPYSSDYAPTIRVSRGGFKSFFWFYSYLIWVGNPQSERIQYRRFGTRWRASCP